MHPRGTTAGAGTTAEAPLLIYHGVYRHPEDLAGFPDAERRYFLSARQIEDHFRCLADLGFHGCSLSQFLEPCGTAARRAVLTFDDGHISNYEIVWPLLEKYGFHATFFAVAGWLERPGYINSGQWRQMLAAGMPVGSHGLTHAALSRLAPGALRQELVRSRQILEQELSVPVRHLALPGGFQTPSVLREALGHYDHVCTSRPGWTSPGPVLPRFSMTAWTGVPEVAGIVRRNPWTLLKIQSFYRIKEAVKAMAGGAAYEALCRRLPLAIPKKTKLKAAAPTADSYKEAP